MLGLGRDLSRHITPWAGENTGKSGGVSSPHLKVGTPNAPAIRGRR